jgi:TRAP-type C4-dicarboxylate transport system permease small subunit
MSDRLRALDKAVYRIERSIVVWSLLVMVVVVFLDVVHRAFSDPDSEMAAWIIKVINFAGGSVDADSSAAKSIHDAAPAGLVATMVWLTYFGFRSAKRDTPLAVGRALGYALGTVFGAGLLIKGLLAAFPNGFIWSQPFALILLLWVGFLGASMCTYEGKHLRVEAVQRYLPERFKPGLALVSGLATAMFLLFLTYASFDYVLFHYSEWIETEYRGGMFKGVDIPRWVGFMALPISFLTMAARFLAAGVIAFKAGDASAHEGSS